MKSRTPRAKPLPGYRFGLCMSVHVASDYEGLAIYKLTVSNTIDNSYAKFDEVRSEFNQYFLDGFWDYFTGAEPWLKHDTMVIWMKSNAPTIDEIGAGEVGGDLVADKAGDGLFNPPYSDATSDCSDPHQTARTNDTGRRARARCNSVPVRPRQDQRDGLVPGRWGDLHAPERLEDAR